MSYNGWSNYETWCVNLWIENDYGSYKHWQKEAHDACTTADDRDEAVDRLAGALKAEHEESMPELRGPWADMLNAAMGEVDWHEIAGYMVDAEKHEWEATA